MDYKEIQQGVYEVLSNRFNLNNLESTLEEMGCNSLDLAELEVTIEEKFGIETDNNLEMMDLSKYSNSMKLTYNDIVEYVANKKSITP